MQPIFLRTIKHKNADEVLKLFEQFRKALKLNKAGTKLETNARNQKLRDIKYNFYDGLVSDLMANSAYSLS
jgi:UDP-N-acetylglucosamine enolpyruvyl transferase